MPYGKVLVVDDVETNLYVAEGLLSPYRLNIETASDGFEAIKRAQNGAIYDVIFMDHMMPLMDGIETTLKLRVLGYKGVIVALTANALVGNEEMFRQNGFDGFISKPIDIRQLNAVLNRFIRDRHPEEAARYKHTASSAEAAVPVQAAELDPKLISIFRQDAEKAVKTLRKTAAGSDIKLFATTAHAVKSALANIGESEMSQAAFALERAALDGDVKFVFNNTENFIVKLEALLNDLPLPVNFTDDGPQTEEDTAYLSQQLEIIKNACIQYDDTTAYTALGKLKEKQWKWEIAYTLEEIHDALFLHSDFEKGEEISRLFLESLPKNG
jgi:CheY-like chemotaxis protein